MPGLRGILLAACCAGLLMSRHAAATDPPAPPAAIQRDEAVLHQLRARELIVERAQTEARARTARIAARKRAGISLLRPVRAASPYGSMLPVMPIDHGIHISR